MDLQSHIEELKERHQALKIMIKEEEARPGANHIEITALKKERLRVKEEIKKLSEKVH